MIEDNAALWEQLNTISIYAQFATDSAELVVTSEID